MDNNFILEYKRGQKGMNKGLPMGSGVDNIYRAINGIQGSSIYVIGAGPKTGKTTFVDYAFLLSPYIYVMDQRKKGNIIDIEWIYFSFEINRVAKEFDFTAFFLNYDYGFEFIKLENNQTHKGKNYIPLSPDYLKGRVLDDEGNIIKVKDKVFEAIKEVYENRIVPLFGRYNHQGILIEKGLVTFVKDRDNPTGLDKFLKHHASQYGKFYGSSTYGNNRNTIYESARPNKKTIVITDHVRKLQPEQRFNMKQIVDKYSEYCCDVRDLCGYTFVHIVHTNRSIVSTDRLKFSKDLLYPTSDDLKETGNLAEDADYVLTMFNPNDERYGLKNHFGINIRDEDNNLLNPNLRTVHLVESRHCFYPQHFKVNMKGNLKTFKQIN